MFSDAYRRIRESAYVLIARSAEKTASCGTAFMIAPGVLATAAHILYQNQGDSSSFQDEIRVMRDPEINSGQKMDEAKVIEIDAIYDIGLIEIEDPRATACISIVNGTVSIGTHVGAVGYPLMDVREIMAQKTVPLMRFQGGHISALYGREDSVSKRQLTYYETDVPMFNGSSGCPGFIVSGDVFGMHVMEWHDGGSREKPGQRAFSMWVPMSAIVEFARRNKIDVPISG